MQFKLLLSVVAISFSSVQGSGYFPSIGGPWSRYTTTTQSPLGSGEGVNLPATEAPAPPSVTFVPRPKPIPQQPPTTSNNGVDGQNQNDNSMLLNNFLVVTDPMTGERFLVPKQNFWNRFGNGDSVQPEWGSNMGQSGQGQGHGSKISQESQSVMEEGFNKEAEDSESFVSQPRSKRSTEAESIEELRENKEDPEEELRHIDMLADDSAEEKSAGDGNFARDSRPNFDYNVNAIESGEDQGLGFGGGRMAFKSSSDLFKMFFPTMRFDQGKKMIYTYTQYRTSPGDESTTASTTTTPTTTTTTPTSTTTEAETVTPPLAIVEVTTIPANEENTEIPETTTVIPPEEASPAPSK